MTISTGASADPSKPAAAAAVAAASRWKGGEDVVLCALVNEFGGGAWNVASSALSAAR